MTQIYRDADDLKCDCGNKLQCRWETVLDCPYKADDGYIILYGGGWCVNCSKGRPISIKIERPEKKKESK